MFLSTCENTCKRLSTNLSSMHHFFIINGCGSKLTTRLLNIRSAYSACITPKLCNPRGFFSVQSRLCHTKKRTHYDILGIEKNASVAEVRAAFLRRCKECHPDINNNNPKNHKQFVLVNEAYTVLSKPLSRRNYDVTLHNCDSGHTKMQAHKNGPYYHYPRGFYEDVNAYRARNMPNDKGHHNHSYYGIPGIKKVPNSTIVALCIVWIFFGITFHYLAFINSSTLRSDVLNRRDVALHEQWRKSMEEAANNQTAVQEHKLDKS